MSPEWTKRSHTLRLNQRWHASTGACNTHMNITYTKRELHLMLSEIESPTDAFTFTYHLLNALTNGYINRDQYKMFKGDLARHLKTI